MSYTPMSAAMGKIKQFYSKYQNDLRTGKSIGRRIRNVERGGYFEEEI